MPSVDALAAWVAQQRWFAGKTARIRELTIDDRVPIGNDVLLVVGVLLDDGSIHRYAIPLAAGATPHDALADDSYARALFDLIGGADRRRGERGEIAGVPTRAFPSRPITTVRRIGGEQSNTSVALGDVAVLKHFRRLAPGTNPEEEITRFLTERARFPHAPRLFGHVEYRHGSATYTLAVAQELATEAEDGWSWMLGALRGALDGASDGAAFLEAAEPTLSALERLGEVTAELHRALASDTTDPDFAPEPIVEADVARWRDGIRRQVDEARAATPGVALPEIPALTETLRSLLGSVRIRHHGDFHLGQTLYRPRSGEWLVIDFEGEPLRPITERRAKHTPLRDVAGLLRSIDYAAVSSGSGDARVRHWERAASRRYLEGYRRRAAGAPFVPRSEAAFAQAVAAFVLEKAAYEIVYEARHRPEWVRIPLEGLTRAASALTSSSAAP